MLLWVSEAWGPIPSRATLPCFPFGRLTHKAIYPRNCISKRAGVREDFQDKPCFYLYSLVRKKYGLWNKITDEFYRMFTQKFPAFPRIFTWREERREVFVSVTQEKLGTKEKLNMAAEASSWLKSYFYARKSMKRLPLSWLAFRNVFSVVYLNFNVRIMAAAGCKTRKMETTLTDRRKIITTARECKTAKVSLNWKAVIYEYWFLFLVVFSFLPLDKFFQFLFHFILPLDKFKI